MDIGEAEVAAAVAVGELFVIETEEVEQGGLEVVHVDAVLHGAEAEVVSGAVGLTAAHPGPGQPDGEAVVVVIAPRGGFEFVVLGELHGGRSAELAAPEDEGFIEKAAGFEVGEQSGEALVALLGQLAVVGLEVVVAVPGLEGAVPDLDVADAALDQSAGDEHLPGLGAVAIQLADGSGLLADVEGVAGLGLHAEGGLEGVKAGLERGVGGVLLEVAGIELLEEAELLALERGGKRGIFEIGDELVGLAVEGLDVGALVGTGKEGALPVVRTGDGHAAGDQDDEAGEVGIFGAEAVGDPGADAGPGHDAGTAVEKAEGVFVNGGVGVHRAHHAEVIRVGGGQAVEQLADLEAGLAVAAEGEGGAEGGAGGPLRGVVDGEPAAVVAGQLRLGVKGVHLGRPAIGEDLDDALGPGQEMRSLGREGMDAGGRGVGGIQPAGLVENGGETGQGEAAAAAPQPVAAVEREVKSRWGRWHRHGWGGFDSGDGGEFVGKQEALGQRSPAGSIGGGGGEEGEGGLAFGSIRLAAEDAAEESVHPGHVPAGLGDLGMGGDGAGLVPDEGVVHQEEGLHGQDGLGAAGDGGVGVGDIEIAQQGGDAEAVGEAVEGAAVVGGIERGAAPAEAGVQPVGDVEEGVAEGLELELAGAAAPEQAVGRVFLQGLGPGLGALLPGLRADEVAVECLDGPAVVDEPGGQVIQQLGVGGLFPGGAEVVRRGDEAGAEVVLPDAVDEDAGGEGIAGTGDGAGQTEAAVIGIGAAVHGGEHLEEAAGHGFAGLAEVAPDQDAGGLQARLQGHGHGAVGGTGDVEQADVIEELAGFFAVAAIDEFFFVEESVEVLADLVAVARRHGRAGAKNEGGGGAAGLSEGGLDERAVDFGGFEHVPRRAVAEGADDFRRVARQATGEKALRGRGEAVARQGDELVPEAEEGLVALAALIQQGLPAVGRSIDQPAAGRVEGDVSLGGAVLGGAADEILEVLGGEGLQMGPGGGKAGVDVGLVSREGGGALGGVLFFRRRGSGTGAREGGQIHWGLKAVENPGERVVVLGGDSVELVVVAACAGEGKAEQAATEDIDAVIHPESGAVGIRAEGAAHAMPTEGAQLQRRGAGKTIRRKLLADELVEGFVGVEGIHHIVAVGVGKGDAALGVGGGLHGVGVTGHIQPVPGPTLAVFRLRQEPVGEALQSVGLGIGSEGLDLLKGWRQADEDEGGAADELPGVRPGAGGKALPSKAGADEAVDGMGGS